ncbi:MAG: ABC transporter permease [Candidatus Thermoplasmatota archaeon]|nr:ABC transporter permease [Candidatus Thermoplasmatota archaeon]
MKRILADVVGFGKQYMRNIAGPFFAFAFPILLILVFGAIFTSDDPARITLPVQDLDEGTHSVEYLTILNSTGVVDIEMVSSSEDITTYIQDNSLAIALVIPANFSGNIDELQAGNLSARASLIVYGDDSRSTYGMAVGAIHSAAEYMNYNLSGTVPIVFFEPRSVVSEEFNFMDFFVPGVVGIVVMTNSLFSMTSICAEYRNRGHFKLLATTRLAKWEWLVSKFIFFTFMLTGSLIVTYAVGIALFDMESSLTPFSIVLIAAGTFLFVSMGMLLGVVVKDPESGAAAANAIGFPMMFLSGAFFPLEIMPSYLQTVAKVIPLTYLNEGLRDTMVYANNESALMNLAVLVVIALVFFVLASRLMSWKER